MLLTVYVIDLLLYVLSCYINAIVNTPTKLYNFIGDVLILYTYIYNIF